MRRRAGKVTDCEFAFIDEFPRANSMILNSMLMLMNEKQYEEEGTLHNAPLMSMFGAANDLPEGAKLGAFADRFTLNYLTGYLNARNRGLLHRRPAGTRYAPTTTIDLADLESLQAQVPGVVFPDTVNAQYDKLLNAADAEGLSLSDRGCIFAKRVMGAHAVLNGRDEANEDDLDILEHCLWRDPKDRAKVRQIVASVVNPLRAKANELIDAALAVYDKLKPVIRLNPTTDSRKLAMDTINKLGECQTEITNLLAAYDGGNVAPLKAAGARVVVMLGNAMAHASGNRATMNAMVDP